MKKKELIEPERHQNLRRSIIRRLLISKNSPWLSIISLVLLSAAFVYSIHKTPGIATLTVILSSIIIVIIIFVISFITTDKGIRLSPLVQQQFYEYDTISVNYEWEILSQDGKNAILRKTRQIQFLSQGIETLREYVWGDEYTEDKKPHSEDFIVKPGHIVDIYREAGKYVIVIALDRKYHKHEILDTYFERQLHNSFINEKEWIEHQPVTNTEEARLKVILPSKRPYKKLWARYRYGDYSIIIDPGEDGFRTFSEKNKTIVEWNLVEPKTRASYLIEWEW